MSRYSCIAAAMPEILPLLAGNSSKYAEALCRRIGVNAANMERVEQFYLPLFTYLEHLLSKPGAERSRPAIIGLSAPQGCGKTTLTESLQEAFELSGRTCTSLSLDDFYLTGEQQDQLSSSRADNEILQCRGNGETTTWQMCAM